jgi:hypothetical protein
MADKFEKQGGGSWGTLGPALLPVPRCFPTGLYDCCPFPTSLLAGQCNIELAINAQKATFTIQG